jgi:hypothetical protein
VANLSRELVESDGFFLSGNYNGSQELNLSDLFFETQLVNQSSVTVGESAILIASSQRESDAIVASKAHLLTAGFSHSESGVPSAVARPSQRPELSLPVQDSSVVAESIINSSQPLNVSGVFTASPAANLSDHYVFSEFAWSDILGLGGLSGSFGQSHSIVSILTSRFAASGQLEVSGSSGDGSSSPRFAVSRRPQKSAPFELSQPFTQAGVWSVHVALGSGTLIGLAVGGTGLLAVIAVLALLAIRRRREQVRPSYSDDAATELDVSAVIPFDDNMASAFVTQAATTTGPGESPWATDTLHEFADVFHFEHDEAGLWREVS